jgi:hypothetical protein
LGVGTSGSGGKYTERRVGMVEIVRTHTGKGKNETY